MARYMPDDVFEAGAYAIASIHVKRSITLADAVNIVFEQYESSYDDDDTRHQWLCAAEKVIGLIQRRYPHIEQPQLASLLETLANFVMAYEPSGVKRKKKFLGGTFFNKNSSPNYSRDEGILRNLPNYLSQVDPSLLPSAYRRPEKHERPVRSDTQETRDAAFRSMESGRFHKALRLLLPLTEIETDWNLYYLIGQCYRYLEDLDNAVNWMERARQENQRESQLLLALGIIYQLQERFDKATKVLKVAIEEEPTNFSAYNSLGLTYRLAGKLNDALEWYERAAEGIVNYGCASIRDQFTREVTVDGERILEVSPGFDDAMLNVLRSNPMYATVQNNIGICHAEMGDVDAARARFLESIRTTPFGYDYPAPREALRLLDEEN